MGHRSHVVPGVIVRVCLSNEQGYGDFIGYVVTSGHQVVHC
ncbi:hypothetical protein T11_7153 [Trichinella zimbabwensis]|uniref:Uncharacterized protein n=1 Tax=Trichinella zimbabwensis TaxID=268475 RepID=A0A0V1GRI6_9BILA|nr:hypothetical protein T11_7153 [Trichinella zimbabwensis]